MGLWSHSWPNNAFRSSFFFLAVSDWTVTLSRSPLRTFCSSFCRWRRSKKKVNSSEVIKDCLKRLCWTASSIDETLYSRALLEQVSKGLTVDGWNGYTSRNLCLCVCVCVVGSDHWKALRFDSSSSKTKGRCLEDYLASVIRRRWDQ